MQPTVNSYSQTLQLLETYAFLQQSLAGLWEIDSTGAAQKKILEADKESDTGLVLWINLASIPLLHIIQIRSYYQSIKDSKEDVVIKGPIVNFPVVSKYPDNVNHHKDFCSPRELLYSKFSIGALKIGAKFVLTHIFS